MKKIISLFVTLNLLNKLASCALEYIMIGDFGLIENMPRTNLNFDALDAYVARI